MRYGSKQQSKGSEEEPGQRVRPRQEEDAVRPPERRAPRLRAKYGVRTARVCKGDTVIVVRGNEDIRNIEGKVLEVYTKTGRVSIEGITINQADGTATERPIHASNLVITKLNTEDAWRVDSLSKNKEAKE